MQENNIVSVGEYISDGLRKTCHDYKDGKIDYRFVYAKIIELGKEWQSTQQPSISIDEKCRMNEIPSDAFNLEVFAIKNTEYGKEAYIGFKISNGNFHFVQVPYTEPMGISIDWNELGKIKLSEEDTKKLIEELSKQPVQWHSEERRFTLKDIEDAFDAGHDFRSSLIINETPLHYPNKEQYIKSLTENKG